MTRCRLPADLSEEQQEMWLRFLDAYTATKTRPAVDMFLRALIGVPDGR